MENKIRITLGTANPHKVHELNSMAEGFNVEFLPLEGQNFNPDENGKTFEENAEIKAKEAARKGGGEYFLADDSGLCVDFLNGAPGIYSARYEETPQKRIEKLLFNLKTAENRQAHFVCALCLVNKDGEILHRETGKVFGKIAVKQCGTNGFGYDPIFLVEGLNKTMAQLTENEKNTLSHRGQAVKQMLKWIVDNLSR